MKRTIKSINFFYSFLLLLAINSQLMAQEIAGIKLDEQVNFSAMDKPLVLNGAGIRYKFFFKIYVGALYLPEKKSSAEIILSSNQVNRIYMQFVYDEVPKSKLVDAWTEGFEDNTDKATFNTLKDKLAQFNAMFSTLLKGDVVLLDYVPGRGTAVNIKGKNMGVIEGADFNRALLSVWLGDEPVTEDLKEAMLGIED